MLTAKTMDNVGAQLLCRAVTARAIDDYIKVAYCDKRIIESDDYDKHQKEVTPRSLVDFFTSPYGEMVTGYSGEFMMNKLHEAKITTVEDPDKFQGLLTYYLNGTGIKRSDIADELGITYGELDRIVSRQRKITQDEFEKMKDIFKRVLS